MVLDAGLAVGLGHATQLRPVKGDHAYELAPEAVNKTEAPEHIVAVEGLMVITGGAFTDTLKEAVSEQKLLETVTLYMLVSVGDTTIEEVMAPVFHK